LRGRIEDVPSLAAHFLQTLAAEMGVKAPKLSDAAMSTLHGYDFPGNIRELKNIIERALIESGGRGIGPEHLHLLQRKASIVSAASSTTATTTASGLPPTKSTKAEAAAALPLNLAEAEDLLIQRALQETGGNIADAARLLGVHRTRIYRKLAQEEPVTPS